MSDAAFELIESFHDEEIDRLVDVYWNGQYGRSGICLAKVMVADEWRTEFDAESYEHDPPQPAEEFRGDASDALDAFEESSGEAPPTDADSHSDDDSAVESNADPATDSDPDAASAPDQPPETVPDQ